MRRGGLAAWLLLGAGCWQQGVIPKPPPPDGTRSLALRGDRCAVDSECAGDLVCEAGVCIPWHRMRGEVPEIEAHELRAWIEAGRVQVIDVRTGPEYVLFGHVEGALHVPIGRLDDRVDALGLDPNVPIVTICQTAHRSIAATRLLNRRGYEAYQLKGGMSRASRAALQRRHRSARRERAARGP